MTKLLIATIPAVQLVDNCPCSFDSGKWFRLDRSLCRCRLTDQWPQPQLGSQPQVGSAAHPQGASQPHAGSAQQPLSQLLCLHFSLPNSFFSMLGFFMPQPLSQQGSTTSQPQTGAAHPQGAATSQPQVGAAHPPQGASQPHAGSAAHPQSQPLCLCLPNNLLSRPHFFLPQPLSQQGSTTSQPQAGAQGAAQPIGSQPQAGSQGASQPQAGSAQQPVSQLLPPQSLSKRPNALASAELVATKAIANSAGTITRRIVISPWKVFRKVLASATSLHIRLACFLSELCPDQALISGGAGRGRSACRDASTTPKAGVHKRLSSRVACNYWRTFSFSRMHADFGADRTS